jgi:hypothetical protein
MQQKSGDIDSDSKTVYTEPVFEAACAISKYLREEQQDQSCGTQAMERMTRYVSKPINPIISRYQSAHIQQ